jgi:alkylhydroperoxidase family enzyme
VGREAGLRDRDILELSDHQTSDAYSDLEKSALDYAIALSDTPAEVSDALFESLREQLSEAQLVELTAVIALENYLARFNRGFDVKAEGLSDSAVCPLPDHHLARNGPGPNLTRAG